LSAAEDLLAVVRLLVDEPRQAAVEAIPVGDADAVELRLRTAETDRGKVIGRRGRTIDALRSLARARGARDGRAIEVELLDD